MKSFEFQLPTKVIFGRDALKKIPKEVSQIGKKALWVYGKDSIKRYGLYEKIKNLLEKSKIEYIEFGGIKSNPLLSKVLEGVKIAKENKIDFILATGGGSVIDTAKAIACGYYNEEKIWDFYERKAFPDRALPLVTILTIAGTGSELNNISVIVNDETRLKLSMSSPVLFPKITFLNPDLTLTVPPDYTAYGAFDAFSHVFEIFISREYKKECLTEDFMIMLMKNIIKWSVKAVNKPDDYEARANMMWASSLALCGLTKSGIGRYRFIIHAIEHTLSGIYDLPHGLGLAILTLAWLKKNKEKNMVKRFFEKVFDLTIKKDKSKLDLGMELFESWLKELRLPLNLKDLKIPKEDLDYLVDKAYQIFTIWKVEEYSKESIKEILETAYSN